MLTTRIPILLSIWLLEFYDGWRYVCMILANCILKWRPSWFLCCYTHLRNKQIVLLNSAYWVTYKHRVWCKNNIMFQDIYTVPSTNIAILCIKIGTILNLSQLYTFYRKTYYLAEFSMPSYLYMPGLVNRYYDLI